MPTTSHPDAGRSFPIWVHWLDIITLLLVIDAIAVASFGGWRLALGDSSLTVTSAWRLAVAAGLLTALRHGVLPRPTLADRLRAWLANPLVSPAGAAAWAVCLTTRAAVLAVGFLAVLAVGFSPAPEHRVSDHELANLPARGHAESFLAVATSGYGGTARAAPGARPVWPAAPLLMRIGGSLLGASTRDVTDFYQRHRWRILWAGVFLAIGAFFWALVYLYRLAADLAGADAAFPAVLLMATYPFAFVFGAVGADSFLLLAALGAVHHARREDWTRSALWGALAGLSDLRGAWLAVPVALLVHGRPAEGLPLRRRARPELGPLLAAGMPLVGLAIALTAMAGATDDWDGVLSGASGTAGPSALDLAAGVLALALLVPIRRRFGWSYALLVCGFLGIGLVWEGFAPGRLTAVCFPLHIELAARLRHRQIPAWTIAASGLQGWLAVLFYTSRWLP